MTTDERGLSEALHRQAEGLGPAAHPLSLEDVQGKARGIRRRRAALSGLAAATVLGITAPLALSMGDSATTDRTPPVASTGVKDGVLTTDVDATSEAPGIPYLYAGQIHLPDGRTLSTPGLWSAFNTLGDGFVVSDGQALALLDVDGEIAHEMPTSDLSFVVSPDHSVVAHVTDGGVQTVGATGDEFTVAVPDEIETPQLVGVKGSETCDPEQSEHDAGCLFYLNDAGTKPGGYTLTSKGIFNRLSGFVFLSGVSDDGWVSGATYVDETEPGSCSEVWDDAFGNGPVWDTCDVMPTTFSPDGTMVIGAPEYRDGFGDSSLAILDASDGAVLAEWQSSEEHQAAITSAVWDEDGTVLAVVQEAGEWSLMRFAPDGGLSKVMDLDSDDPESAPLVLPESS